MLRAKAFPNGENYYNSSSWRKVSSENRLEIERERETKERKNLKGVERNGVR